MPSTRDLVVASLAIETGTVLDRNRLVLPAEFVEATEDQWVPLDPTLRQAVLALPRSGPAVFRFTKYSRYGKADGDPLGAKAVSERVIRLAKEAGVRLSMHSLRKGFGCAYAGTVPAQVRQKLMRHANITTTINYHANVDDAVEAAVVTHGRKSLPAFDTSNGRNEEGKLNTSLNTNPDGSSGDDGGVTASPCQD